MFASLGGYDRGDGTFVLSAQLFANDAATNLPTGAALTSFAFNPATIPPPPSGSNKPTFANVELDPTSIVTLDAAKGYWLVLAGASDDGLGSTYWQWALSGAHSGPGDIPHYSNYSAGQWNGPFPAPGTTNQPYLIEALGSSAVPEPASWVMGCIGISVLLGVSRWSAFCRRAR